ncbi:MAG TPA: hypothetical protein VFJ30_13485 [Phycisphaerae bacterium]|nr:hypothetical protein [Phycisphaerae bacterium]
MGKMYYSEEEAAHRLGVPVEQLRTMVEQGKLSSYSDGSKQMYRAAQVDAIAPSDPSEDTGPIELSPADTGGGTVEGVALSAADEPAPSGKGDTVITSDGISIFDDLEIETDDPMAKTAIVATPGADQEVMMEGVGGGSGLGRLAEEKDDTSLGPALDQIPEADGFGGSGGASDVLGSLEEEDLGGSVATAAVSVERVVEQTVEEELDPSAGAFAGLLVGVALLALLVGMVAVPVMMGLEPGYLTALQENLPAVVGVSALLLIILAVAGYFIGKSAVQQAEALKRSR